MKNDVEYGKDYWSEFTKNEKCNEKLNPIVKESWIRCKKSGIDYINGNIIKASKSELNLKLEKNKELITVSRPIMENLYNIVEGSGFVIILTDRDGYIIDLIGDEELIKIENSNFVVGTSWAEESIGTNAIGTALYLDKPVQVIGAEHYYEKNHFYTCSAAPIHNEDGYIIGSINMSGNYSKAHSHTTAIVVSGAYSIENQLTLIKSNRVLNVIFDSMSEGMLLLDENLKIKSTNKMASKILGISTEEILKTSINTLLKNIDFIKNALNVDRNYHNLDYNFYVKSRRIKCSINAFPVIINEKVKGTVITFNSEGYMHKVASTIAGFSASYKFEDIITKSEDMKKTIEFAKRAALTSCNVLVEGPSGTGKELFAQSMHNYSDRSGGPFVAVNCASLPKELMESELFGYEKGAFTGATKEGHPGKFELANEGTIFLDEIGELPLDMQSKLLRVLDNNKITRLGGTYEKILNVRVIAATNRNLQQEIKNKNFREDLYYRLNVMNIKTIALNERVEDIETLAKYFVYRLNLKNSNNAKTLSEGYLNCIKKYSWPGNVRELRNVVERSYYLCELDNINEEFLYDYIVKTETTITQNQKGIMYMEEMEAENIRNAINQSNGDLIKAARILNISRATIYRKVKKYSIK
ncbi:sigma-54-dependent Fis family transcriptional regulator [Clostridium drakei]|uniref:Sigma-54-dependent Fis family transcriptional regulator n=1 Tax=Clostridium drakei TaxID=332101 RepID=A0A2U8DN13_9CLOT|nr:sigma-54-dependent Fis family transcriptional regulator [Clostridium drakei]AWI03835.1 sigma-54-dependent Fis family transcriptional regulator [Clostridium drakei]